MPLLGLDLKEGLDTSLSRITDPFKDKSISTVEMSGAISRNDFIHGFIMTEFQEGVELEKETITFKGSWMPKIPFTFGGQQKIVKDYYPGNSEPAVHILGPRENSIIIRGTMKSNRFHENRFSGISLEDLRAAPEEMQELITAMRIRGNVIRFTMGGFQRFGFIEEDKFDLRTLADIGYEITLSIIGFNPPRDCKVLNASRTVPIEINKNLISQVLDFQGKADIIPATIPKSLGDQIRNAVAEIAGVINLVTGFIDAVLTEVDDIKASAARAQGLIKNARANLSSFQRRIGAFDPLAQVSSSTGNGISAGYLNATYLQTTLSNSFSLVALLAGLADQLKQLAETIPLARHSVRAGDTLQTIAIKFYGDANEWKIIFDHNKLQDVELTLGSILEIPRQ